MGVTKTGASTESTNGIPRRRGIGGPLALTLACLALGACRDEARVGGRADAEVFAVGMPLGATTSAEIGASGGTLSLGELTVTVPAGAVDSTTTFRISAISRTAPGSSAPAFRLEPHGLHFAVPVVLEFTAPSASSGAGVAITQDDAGHWLAVPSSDHDASSGTLRVATDHFSDWTYAESFVLEASSYSLRTGESTDLVVKNCFPRDHLDPSGLVLPALVSTCEPIAGESFVEDESANGVPGGDAEVGLVTRQGATLRYTAPASVPDSNPVAISLALEDYGRATRLLLVANLTVVDDVAYRGTATTVDGSFSAEVSFTESESFGEVVQYVPSGTIGYSVAGCTVSPSRGEISPDDGYLEIDYSYSPPRYYGSAFSSWEAVVTCGSDTYTMTVLAPWFATVGSVDATTNGTRLEGTSSVGTWSFEKTP